ncbi:apolipoprotein Eb-like [Centropristis striata]|uniref:apolipoprotein Eb-like n=1 Tax=Centropristis striata TaxID=184440 RepID=UPI0027E10B56|nr:apolipoprotein Eb-like [Centropristis striata]
MKTVALFLALAVITGCNARAVSKANATPNDWEKTVDQFCLYVSDVNQKAGGVVQDLKVSQLSKELDTLITDSMAELATYRDDSQTKIVPFTKTSHSQMSQYPQALSTKLQKDMLDTKGHAVKYLHELKTLMDQNRNDVRRQINTYANKLKYHLNRETDEIRHTVATYLGELQYRTSHNLHYPKPYVKQVSDTANKQMSDITTLLHTQAQGLGQHLQNQAQGIRTHVGAVAESLHTNLEGKMHDLTGVRDDSPYATNVREQIKNVMQVKQPSKS